MNRVQFEQLGNYIGSTENFEFHENTEVVVFWVPKRVFFVAKRQCFESGFVSTR